MSENNKINNSSNVIQFPESDSRQIDNSSNSEIVVTKDLNKPINNPILAQEFYQTNKSIALDPKKFYVDKPRFLVDFNDQPYSTIDLISEKKLFTTRKKRNRNLLGLAESFLKDNQYLQKQLLSDFEIEIQQNNDNKQFDWELKDKSLRGLIERPGSGSAPNKEVALAQAKNQLKQIIASIFVLEIFKPASLRLITNQGQEIDLYLKITSSFYDSFKYQAQWKQSSSTGRAISHRIETDKPHKLLTKALQKIHAIENEVNFKKNEIKMTINGSNLDSV
jgi:hypothetical protein